MDPDDGSNAECRFGRAKQKRPVVRHARSSTRVLKEWFAAHPLWPYPTEQEKEALSERTEMTIRQVSYWFVNARRRNGHKLSSSAPANTNSSLEPLLAGPSLPQGHDWSTMNPLERWRHSPPDQEPAPLHAISASVQRDIYDLWSIPDHAQNAPEIPASAISGPSSTSSVDFSISRGSSDSSAHSYKSDSSLNHPTQRILRSRKKRSHKALSRQTGKTWNLDESKDSHERIYQCTFCTDTFKSRYDWTRHEESLHLALERWTCLPFGPTFINSAGQTQCAFCDVQSPDDPHLRSHQVHKCTGKPVYARNFRRKDHLRQHLRLVHGVQEMTSSMSKWKSTVSEINSRCGFCGETFLLWSDRNDHLTDHFRAGSLMKDWKGCRGLDPVVALFVENAIPPYLIGTEAKDADPFSASKGNAKTGSVNRGSSVAPSAYGALTADLGDYVRTMRSAGVDVTDDALRQQSRLIFYGDDDPWNQTPADNNQWLDMFKAGWGLGHDPLQQQATVDRTSNVCASSQPLNTNSCSPFTAESIQHAVGFDPAMMQFELNLDVGLGNDPSPVLDPAFTIPWSWQTPECLAEFRQLGLLPMNDAMNALGNSCSINEPATSIALCDSLSRPAQAFNTAQTSTFAAPTPPCSSGMGNIPAKDLSDDILFVFDTELG